MKRRLFLKLAVLAAGAVAVARPKRKRQWTLTGMVVHYDPATGKPISVWAAFDDLQTGHQVETSQVDELGIGKTVGTGEVCWYAHMQLPDGTLKVCPLPLA